MKGGEKVRKSLLLLPSGWGLQAPSSPTLSSQHPPHPAQHQTHVFHVRGCCKTHSPASACPSEPWSWRVCCAQEVQPRGRILADRSSTRQLF